MYNLAKSSKKVSEVDKPLAQQTKEYWGETLAQIKQLDPVKDERGIWNKARAPLEHIFYSHQYCGDWCYKKKAIERGEVYQPPANIPF